MVLLLIDLCRTQKFGPLEPVAKDRHLDFTPLQEKKIVAKVDLLLTFADEGIFSPPSPLATQPDTPISTMYIIGIKNG